MLEFFANLFSLVCWLVVGTIQLCNEQDAAAILDYVFAIINIANIIYLYIKKGKKKDDKDRCSTFYEY